MASLTSYFKIVPSPAKVAAEEKQQKATAAAAGSKMSNATEAVPPSPSKPTAASRKRKAEQTEAEVKEQVEGALAAAAVNAELSAQADEAAAAVSDAAPVPDTSAVAAASSSSAASSTPAKKARLEDLPKYPPDSLESLLPPSWLRVLLPELSKPYWSKLKAFLQAQAQANVTVFPQRAHIFRALDLCPLEKVKVVILGQDPYHDVGQAEGLSFSVPHGMAIPSSLRNIYKELSNDLGPSFKRPTHGHLSKWAEQGVLLLNTGLTVKAHAANSHKAAGWHYFTDAIIKAINKERRGVVFLLWGKHAQDKAKLIDPSWHHILMSAHPSGLSANRGFFGCRHFSKTNALLKKDGQEPIDWQV